MPTRFVTIVGPSAGPRTAGEIDKNVDEERVWRDALKVSTAAGVSYLTATLPNRGLTNDQAVRFCAYLLKHVNLLRKHGGTKRVVVRKLDMSDNRLDNDGLERVMTTLGGEMCNSIGVLKLHENDLSAPGPFVKLLASGNLSELHLSHNKFCRDAVEEMVAGVLLASEGDGWKYPRNGVPLWLRAENQKRVAKNAHGCDVLSDGFACRLAKEGRPLSRNVCVVDGKTWCCPQACHCFQPPAAVHLTYVGVPSRNGAKRSGRIAVGTKAPVQRKEELRKPPTPAPWLRDIGGAATPSPDETFFEGMLLDAEQFPALGTNGANAEQPRHDAELAPGRRVSKRWRKGLLRQQEEGTVESTTGVGAIGADDFPALCAIEEAHCSEANSKTRGNGSGRANVGRDASRLQTTPEPPSSLQPFAPAQSAPCKIATTCYRAESPYCLALESGDVVSFEEDCRMMVGTDAYVYGRNLKTMNQGWFPTRVL